MPAHNTRERVLQYEKIEIISIKPTNIINLQATDVSTKDPVNNRRNWRSELKSSPFRDGRLRNIVKNEIL